MPDLEDKGTEKLPTYRKEPGQIGWGVERTDLIDRIALKQIDK
jgi:hypothetical protein